MEFCLHYNGKLKSRDTATGKHEIRKMLHPQIKALCNIEPYKHLLEADFNNVRKPGEQTMFVEHDGKRFWFVISEHLSMVVDISIILLLPHSVGRIVHNGGDIDNRIKTLFDALRVPSVSSEIPKSDEFDYTSGGMFCLLQDDKLLNRVAIRSYQDYDPDAPDSIRCIMEFETKITRATFGNLSFA